MKLIHLFSILILNYCGVFASAGLFDINEIKQVSYKTELTDNFLWFAPEVDISLINDQNVDDYEKQIIEKLPKESESDYLFVTNNGGQRFICKIPIVQINETEKKEESSKNPKFYASYIAASFYVNKCIQLRSNGWWSYELCRGQTIEQIHGKKGEDGYTKNILGMFDGSYSLPSFTKSTAERLFYVEELYSTGTLCDLEDNKKPRSTIVRYECDSSLSSNEAYIVSLDEVQPCSYVMIVRVGSLCALPEFLPPKQTNSHSIGCHPYIEPSNVRDLLMEHVDNKKQKVVFQEKSKDLKEKMVLLTRRLAAMKRTSIKYSEKDIDILSKLESEYASLNFDLMVALLNEKEGKQLSTDREDALWSLISMAKFPEYINYANYKSTKDENKGNLWYYFNSKSWPKDEFPKDLHYAVIRNGVFNSLAEIGLEKILNGAGKGEAFFSQNIANDELINRMSVMKFEWQRILGSEYSFGETGGIQHRMINFYIETENYEQNMLPMADFSKKTIEMLINEIDVFYDQILYDGYETLNSLKEGEIGNSAMFKYVKYYSLGNTHPDYHYKIKIDKNLDEIRDELEIEFEKELAPFYLSIGARYHIKLNPRMPYELSSFEDEQHDYYEFNSWLGKDMIQLSRVLAAAATWKMKKMIDLIDKPINSKTSNFAYFLRDWPLSKVAIEAKRKIPDDIVLKRVLHEIARGSGKREFDEAKKSAWTKLKSTFISRFEKEDKKKRIEGETMIKTMNSLLGDDNSDVTPTILTVNEFFSDLKQKDSIESLIKEMSDVKVELDALESSESLQKTFDLLEKIGFGSENIEVKMEVIDIDGKQIIGDDAITIGRTFDEFEEKQKIAKENRIYSMKKKYENKRNQEKTSEKE